MKFVETLDLSNEAVSELFRYSAGEFGFEEISASLSRRVWEEPRLS